MTTLSITLMAAAIFVLLLMLLFVGIANLLYVHGIHKWHQTCKRLDVQRDENHRVIVETLRATAQALRDVSGRHENIAHLLVGLTNQVLSLTQDNIRNSVAPPKRGPED